MNRILVIGCAGSGKSTLSMQLGEFLQLPVIHLDKYYWKPNWTPTPNEEWDQFIMEAVEQERWILDGNYSRTLDLRMKRADTILFLDMPRLLCISRIIKRRMKYHGRTRPDLNEDCPEKLDWTFFSWVWNYKNRGRIRILEKLEQVKDDKQVIIVNSKNQVNELINHMKNNGGIENWNKDMISEE